MKIMPSISRSAQFGRLEFPTREDYVKYFLEQKIASKEEEIWSNEEYVNVIHRHWHGEGRNGCIFALLAARRANELGWQNYVITQEISAIEDEIWGFELEQRIETAIADPKCEILSLLFSNLTELNDLVRLIRFLIKLEPFLIVEEQQVDELVAIALRIAIEKDVMSWLMIFGPLQHFPQTRQAPILEITIRVKPKPSEQFHKLSKEKDAAHLADLPLDFSDEVMEQTWINTLKRTRQIIGGEPNHLSAAKTTVSIPIKNWNSFK